MIYGFEGFFYNIWFVVFMMLLFNIFIGKFWNKKVSIEYFILYVDLVVEMLYVGYILL